MKRFFPRPRFAGLLCALALPAWAAFTDNGDGTITDTSTGLVWDKCSRGQVWDNTTPPGTCTATAHTGYRFTGWGGSCSGSASPCTLTNVTAATNVSAQFAPASAQAIPTLGEWAMLLLTGLMGLGAMVALRRR